MDQNKYDYNLLIGVTGSVAAIKLSNLINNLKLSKKKNVNFNIRIVYTEKSLHFFNKLDLIKLNVEIFDDNNEWNMWNRINDPILHIQLRNWADLFLIAPLDANTLAKIANGICDNLLTCIVRAWDLKKKLIFAPAMNTFMYIHPLTKKHIEFLKSLGYFEIPSIYKNLACGDFGLGGMAEVETISNFILNLIENKLL